MKNILLIISILVSFAGFSQVANYGFTSTTSTWSYNSSPTTIHSTAVDDALSSPINIGFTFIYDGVSYTQFKASSNGFITFNTANTLAQTTNNLKTSTNRVILAVLWDDSKTGNGNVNYKLTGTSPSRVLTIEWKSLVWNKWGYSAGTIDCQIKLYETTNVIEYVYNRGSYQSFSNSNSVGASIGLGGATSGDFLSLSDLIVSPSKSTTSETTTIGSSPTNLTLLTAAQANIVIPNGTKYRFYPPAINDNCISSPILTVNSGSSCTTTSNGTTIGAAQSLAACVGTADDDVWYSFIATQPVHVLTETPGTIGDAVVQAYSGSCSVLSTIACVNEVTTGNEVVTLTGLTIGDTYLMRIHSYANDSSQGTFSICVNTPPTIITSGTLSEFSSCTGTVSSEQNYNVSGSGLTDDIIITAPDEFEISKTSGGSFTSTITLAQSSGVVSSTTIYVRVKTTAIGNPSGNITNTSTNATTKNIAVSDAVSPYSMGGSVGTNQNVNSGQNASTINLTGNTGSVIKWQKSSISDFSTFTDISNTTTSVTGASIGAITQTVYYRAVVQSGSCPVSYSSYVTIEVINSLPISLLYFEGYQHDRFENRLRWATASEDNNDYFSIEKTLDGILYVELGRIRGAGNSASLLYYGFIDGHIEHIINYYRLKQTDYDGRYTYSELISIDNRDGVEKPKIINIVNTLGQPVDKHFVGTIIIEYSDGTHRMTVQF